MNILCFSHFSIVTIESLRATSLPVSQTVSPSWRPAWKTSSIFPYCAAAFAHATAAATGLVAFWQQRSQKQQTDGENAFAIGRILPVAASVPASVARPATAAVAAAVLALLHHMTRNDRGQWQYNNITTFVLTYIWLFSFRNSMQSSYARSHPHFHHFVTQYSTLSEEWCQ